METGNTYPEMLVEHVRSASTVPELNRLPTRIPGLDIVLGGGLLVGDTYLIAGEPGTGKTTLGNQMAFAHASAGGAVLFATLLTESHDRMLAHLHGFSFANHSLVGERIHYISLLATLQEADVDGALQIVMKSIREHGASLLVIDGARAARMFAHSQFDYIQFLHGLQARTALLGCTSVLLGSRQQEVESATHVDGVIALSAPSTDVGDVRLLQILKFRGSRYLPGRHSFIIGDDGISVFPRLEAAHASLKPKWVESGERLAFGISEIDRMIGGGLAAGSSTLIVGTPGAGKTILGLYFLIEGAGQGETGLLEGFNETSPALVSTAERVGMDLGTHLESGLIQLMWRPSLELTPDEWAWELLAAVDKYNPRRLVIDSFSDLLPFFATPQRVSRFATALANRLRDRGVTTLFQLEIDSFASSEVSMPIPHLAATMDNTVLLRTVELHSSLHRMVSILKQRQTGFDPSIREFTIGPVGIELGERFNAHALLTGSAIPWSEH